jgi:hypothetical protein
LCSSTLAVTFNGGSHREKEENKIVRLSVQFDKMFRLNE